MVCSFCLKYQSDLRVTFHFWILKLDLGKVRETHPYSEGKLPNPKQTENHTNTPSTRTSFVWDHVLGWGPWVVLSPISLYPSSRRHIEWYRGWGAVSRSVMSIYVNTGQHHLPAPPLPTHTSGPVCGEFTPHTGMVFILLRQRGYPSEVSVS